MPRLLAPLKVDSFTRTSASSLRGSKSSLTKLNSIGSTSSRSPPSRRTSFSRDYNKGSQSQAQFSLSRKRTGGQSTTSTSSLRRQKSSRQNSLLSYTQMEEPKKHNDEWNFAQTQPSTKNAFWDIVNQGSVSQAPSLISSENSVLTADSSQASLQPSGHHSPPTSLPSPADDVRNDLLHRLALHKTSLQRPTNVPTVSPGNSVGRTPPQHPSILHATNALQRAQRNSSFIPPSQIREEDPWGHFVETADVEEQLDHRSRLVAARRKYPASFSVSSAAHIWG